MLEQLPIADNGIARAKPLIVVLRRQMGKAPPGIKIKHVIAAKLSVNRITAVRCQRWDHNQIAHLQMVFLAIAQAAFPPRELLQSRAESGDAAYRPAGFARCCAVPAKGAVHHARTIVEYPGCASHRLLPESNDSL